MTAEERSAWVGDQVFDEDAGKEGIVSDVKAGTFVIRELYARPLTWTAPGPERLRITVTREERIKQRQELGW
ncbi:hypothetical protein AB0912_24410 [Streptomyces sp. NPDC007084]|uniref:hypothetical protein n=1 Tax=Streptomyces sp. NPDC007084 TaxID=3154313 RepID=UPI003456B03C